MKTINAKNTFKLLFFLLILFSAKTFSNPKLPNDESSSGTGSKIGCVNNSTASKGIAMQPKKTIALRNNSKVSLKTGIGK
jgi:hypothetical protein